MTPNGLPPDWRSRITPDHVTSLAPDQVFVFGSNLRGIHGAGAARQAWQQFGAQRGVGEGPTGRCYALPTKRTPWEKMKLWEVEHSVEMFLAYARQCFTYNPVETFLVVEVGCKLAGFTPEQIAPLFRPPPNGLPPNLWLPLSFWNVLAEHGGQ